MSWLASDAVWPPLGKEGERSGCCRKSTGDEISGHRWLTRGSCWHSWAGRRAASVNLISSSMSPHYLLQVANFAEPVSNCR
jgi:hypothetical protein